MSFRQSTVRLMGSEPKQTNTGGFRGAVRRVVGLRVTAMRLIRWAVGVGERDDPSWERPHAAACPATP